MIDVNIGLNSYKLPLYWDNITLSEGIELHTLCKKTIPKPLQEKYKLILSSKDEKTLGEELVLWSESLDIDYSEEQLPRFIKGLLNFWHIPHDVTDKCTLDSLITIYVDYIEIFVVGIMNKGVGYNAVGIEGITISKQKFTLPPEKHLGSEIIPMYNLSTVQFCECADLLNYIDGEGFKLMSYFVSTLLLDGAYDEDEVLDNAKLFEEIPMDLVWECVHAFSVFHNYVSKRFTNVFSGGGSKSGVKLSNSWRKFIMDIHIKSNYMKSVMDIEDERILHTLEVSDRESEVTDYQNKLQEESIKKSKK